MGNVSKTSSSLENARILKQYADKSSVYVSVVLLIVHINYEGFVEEETITINC